MLLKVFFPGSLRMDARFSNWRKESEEKKTRQIHQVLPLGALTVIYFISLY